MLMLLENGPFDALGILDDWDWKHRLFDDGMPRTFYVVDEAKVVEAARRGFIAPDKLQELGIEALVFQGDVG